MSEKFIGVGLEEVKDLAKTMGWKVMYKEKYQGEYNVYWGIIDDYENHNDCEIIAIAWNFDNPKFRVNGFYRPLPENYLIDVPTDKRCALPKLLVKSLCERFLRKLFERKKKQKKPVKILMTGLKTDFFKIYFFLFIRVSAHNFKRD